ncbi:ankyrin repeat domain-containing protein [Cardiobacterium valvarum]|uniref:Ankyrin repeat protein n=1 Tax=Cardiobacterium valvarum F0432 TaxID=797473 RepID=G9ZJS8_9GAMM|nr:ankyrin repeat domain-containing protein [Cardiobacterium valvarum]EHM49558.1 ankyrin repeat protein [Cardiobacterium valvarum F0432]
MKKILLALAFSSASLTAWAENAWTYCDDMYVIRSECTPQAIVTRLTYRHPLYQAARAGDKAGGEVLIREGNDLNRVYGRGGFLPRSLLNLSLFEEDKQAFATLLALGADPNFLGKQEETPMHAAAKKEDPWYLETLLAHGGDANVRDIDGKTPLFAAASLGGSGSIERLVRAGADVQAKDEDEQTPLFAVIGSLNKGSFTQLLDAGADIHATDNDGNTLLHASAGYGFRNNDTFWRLLQMGVDPRAKNRYGNTFQCDFFFKVPSDEPFATQVRDWLTARGIPLDSETDCHPVPAKPSKYWESRMPHSVKPAQR